MCSPSEEMRSSRIVRSRDPVRFFEARGRIRQAVSVVKKRGGDHERTIREFGFERGSIWVGAALDQVRGVLTGVPVYEGPLERPGTTDDGQ